MHLMRKIFYLGYIQNPKPMNKFLLLSIIFFSLIRGLASGLGWVIGATLLVSILTFFLSQIEFIPIIGDWVSRLIEQIQKFDRY